MTEKLLSQRYRIACALGVGGMGRTYLAEDTHMPGHPKCVVKQLKPASQESAVMATAKRLFYSEAETLQKLGEHDRIPRLLAYFEQKGEFYLVQEYIEGHPLTQELLPGQRWSEAEAIALLREVLEILTVVHGQGVIHRDIKPDNIMRRKRDGRLVLIDFGAVKQIHLQPPTTLSRASLTVVVGTMGYMPMEQARGKPRSSSDLYATGMIVIQAVTGRLPLQLHEDEAGEVVWEDCAQIGDDLKAILTKMTRHHLHQRYQAATEALEALQQLDEATSTTAKPIGQALPPPSRTPTVVASSVGRGRPVSVLAPAETVRISTTQKRTVRAKTASKLAAPWLWGFGMVAIATGVLATALVTYLSWHEKAFAKSIDEIGTLLDRGDYGACINKASALQQQTNFLVTLKSSMALDSPERDSLTNLLADCQLKQGGVLAESGKYEGAIALIDSINFEARVYGEAQEFKKSLLEVLEVLQADEVLYLQAEEAFVRGFWDDVITVANKIVSGQWQEKVEPLRDEANAKIAARIAAERTRREAEEQSKRERERQEQLRLQRERERQERIQKEQLEQQKERERLEQERLEREKKEREAWCSRNSGC